MKKVQINHNEIHDYYIEYTKSKENSFCVLQENFKKCYFEIFLIVSNHDFFKDTWNRIQICIKNSKYEEAQEIFKILKDLINAYLLYKDPIEYIDIYEETYFRNTIYTFSKNIYLTNSGKIEIK